MSEISAQQVIRESAEATTLLAGFTAQAASRLEGTTVAQSRDLPTEEMGRRVAAALAALRGDAPKIDEKPSEVFSPEAQLRKENRIQDDPAILAKLGYSGELPQVPAGLIEECARTSGTVVLRFKTTLIDLQSNVNKALGADKKNLHLYVDSGARSLATTNDKPEWINVPNTVRDETLGLSKTSAKAQVKGETCDPMDTVLMLSYNNFQTGQQMPGFINKWTFTDQRNTLVGSHGDGIYVGVGDDYDADGSGDVGLAPRFAPESKI